MDQLSGLSGGAVPGAKWHDLYQAAMLELDDGKLPVRISAARHAILDRAKEIPTASPNDERQALNDALRALSVLQTVAAKENPEA
jgi:hypothetical protein